MKDHKCGFCGREITDRDLGGAAYSAVWKLPADYLDGEELEHAYKITGQRLRDFIETGEIHLVPKEEGADKRFLQKLRRRREEERKNGQG